MGNRIIKTACWMLSNFFLLILILRLFKMINVDLRIMQIMSITFLFGGFCCLKRIRIHGFDMIILLYLSYMILNGLTIKFIHHEEFLYRALLAHVFPVMCYFIGRYTQIDIRIYIQKMKWPILFAMICGLYFYFQSPPWYIAMKEALIRENTSEMSVLGIYRLSSFWGHPYILAYATFFYSLFISAKIIHGIKKRKELFFYIFSLIICLFVLFLAQLRVTIIVYVFCIFYMIIYNKKESLSKKVNKIIKILFLIICIAFLFFKLASNSIDYIYAHMMHLTENDALLNRFSHTAGGIENYSLFGDGLGRYGFLARDYGMWAIVDHEYQCHTAELGYIGIFILCVIISFSLYKCFKRSHLIIENSILLFFFMSMIGASVLSNSHQYNYIFWYTLGLLWSRHYNIYRKHGI